jgi:hypothetical protein
MRMEKLSNIDKKLLYRLRIFLAIFIIMVCVIAYDVYVGTITVFIALDGLFIGILLGFVVGRVFHISWDYDRSKVIGRLDKIGIIILICYLIFSLFKFWILEQWLHGPLLTAFSLSIIAGIMLGRWISIGLNIRQVLYNRGMV